MGNPKIISFGEVLWDLFPDGECFGGAPANFACHAALQGADVTMVSAVGDDHRGHSALEILRSYDIDTSLCQIVTGVPTGSVGVALDSNGKPTFEIHPNSAWDHIAWNQTVASCVAASDAIYFGTLGQRSDVSRATIRRAAKEATAAGIPCVLDINLRAPFFDTALIRESIQLASILKLSDDEFDDVCAACDIPTTGEPQAKLRLLISDWNLDMIVMTNGPKGALVVTADSTVRQQGIATTVVDTVGAGDSFTAAFLTGRLRAGSLAESLRKACEIAAVACSHAGAVPPKTKEQRIQ